MYVCIWMYILAGWRYVFRSATFVAPGACLVGSKLLAVASNEYKAVVWRDVGCGMWWCCSRSAGTRLSTVECVLRRSKREQCATAAAAWIKVRVVERAQVGIKKGSGRRETSTITYRKVDWRQDRKRACTQAESRRTCVAEVSISIHRGEHDCP